MEARRPRSGRAGWTGTLAVLALLALAVLLALGGCGGGGGGSSPPAPPPQTFTLSVTSSGNGSVTSNTGGIDCGAACSADVPAGTDVTLTATPAAGHALQGWGGACSGSAGTCTVSMTAARSVTATFAAASAAAWSDTALVSAPGADQPRVVIDAAGNATAIWRQRDGGVSRHSVWASRRPAGGAWSAPVAVESSDNDIPHAALAVEPASGRVMAVWGELTNGGIEVRARPADATGTWGTTALISAAGRNVGSVHVGMDAAGNAVAVWSQTDTGSTNSVWSNRYAVASGWGSAVRVANDGEQDLDPSLAVAGNGQAVVVWSRLGSGIWANRADANGNWGTRTQLAAGLINVNVGSPRVAADASGSAMAVWAQSAISSGQVVTNLVSKRWSNGAWSTTATPLYTPVATDVLSEVRLAVNAQGRFVAAWAQADNRVRAVLSDGAGAWGSPTVARAAGSDTLSSLPSIGIDGFGDMFVVWAQRQATSSIDDVWLNRFTGGAWGAAALHQQDGEATATPRLAMNDRGDAVAVWIRYGSDGSRVASRSFTSGR